MKTLYIECGMGAAGDMLTAALLELLPDNDKLLEELNALGIPGVHIKKEPSSKCGICGTHISVTVDGEEEDVKDVHTHEHEHPHIHEHEHQHEHEHIHEHEHEHQHEQSHDSEHNHEHHHSDMHEIEHIICSLNLPAKVQADVLAVYNLIAEAESNAHGIPVTDIHFHEVGTMDAIADITAVCLIMKRLSPQQVIVSPIHVGSGHVHCAHGILPVPAPATAYILRDVPIYGGAVSGELCTPTGAALLKHFASSFGDMPVMKVKAIGYGMGRKDFQAANCVRAMLGETQDTYERISELRCNVDDMTAEAVGFATERLFEAGAIEVFTVNVGMKKSRPGTMLCILCRESDKERIIKACFLHTSTIGIRESVCNRYTLERSVVALETPYGSVRRKDSAGYGTVRSKYEYEDIARIAKESGISLKEATAMIESADTQKGSQLLQDEEQ